MFASFAHASSSVLALRGVKRCIVVSPNEDNIRDDEEVGRPLAMAALDIGQRLLSATEDKRIEHSLDHILVARRFEDVALVVIGDEQLDTNDVLRKLNVIAIRAQVVSSKSETKNPIVEELREAYVAVAGPLGALVFDRALDELKRTRRNLDVPVLRPFIESLASTLAPPTNHRLLDKVTGLLAKWETSAGVYRAPTSSIPARASSGPLASSPSAPPAPASSRASSIPPVRRTFLHSADLQRLVREMVGPLGDHLIQRAVEKVALPGSEAIDTEALLVTIAQQLPLQHRERFMADARAVFSTPADTNG